MAKKKTEEVVKTVGKIDFSKSTPKELQEFHTRLEKLEKNIHLKLFNFMDVVIHLGEIKDKTLYLLKKDDDGNQLYKTFGEYVEQEFNFKRSYYSRLNKAYRTYELVSSKMGNDEREGLPKYPAFYDALSDVKEDRRLDALKAVRDKEEKNNQRLTALDITNWAQENGALEEKKQKKYEEGPVKQVSIFAGLATKIVDTDDFKKNNKINVKEKDKKMLIENLKKILDLLKKM